MDKSKLLIEIGLHGPLDCLTSVGLSNDLLLHADKAFNLLPLLCFHINPMMTSSNGNISRVTGHLCGNSPVTGEFTSQSQWRGALMFSLFYAWINGWVNNGEPGDLRCHRAQYDAVVIQLRAQWWGKFVITFLYVQFWIRLAAVSKRDKKVRTVAFLVVRSVNKSRDTRNCVQNKPEYAICVIFTTRSYYKALWLILCYLI